jgi:hypothetical protein
MPGWCTPGILATQEAEVRRIAVHSQPRQTVHKTLSQKYPTQKKKLGGAGGVAQSVGPEFKPQYSPSPQKKICHKYLRFGRLHMVKLWSVFSFFVFSIL